MGEMMGFGMRKRTSWQPRLLPASVQLDLRAAVDPKKFKTQAERVAEIGRVVLAARKRFPQYFKR